MKEWLLKYEYQIERFKTTTHYSHVIEAQKDVDVTYVNFCQPEPEKDFPLDSEYIDLLTQEELIEADGILARPFNFYGCYLKLTTD